jgi:hypothetical protein
VAAQELLRAQAAQQLKFHQGIILMRRTARACQVAIDVH